MLNSSNLKHNIKIFIPYINHKINLENLDIDSKILDFIDFKNIKSYINRFKFTNDIGDNFFRNFLNLFNLENNFRRSFPNFIFQLLMYKYENIKQDKFAFDYIGFFEDRRFLNFGVQDQNFHFINFNNKAKNLANLNDDTIKSYIKNYDLILPYKTSFFSKGLEDYSSAYHYYSNVGFKEHIDKLSFIISRDYPNFINAKNKFFESKDGIIFQIFIMNKNYFHQYINFIINIFNQFSDNILILDKLDQISFMNILSEILFNIFINYIELNDKKVRIYFTKSIAYKDVPGLDIDIDYSKVNLMKNVAVKDDTDNKNTELIKNNEENINIVFSIDDKYIKHFSATLVSILKNSNQYVNFNIFILDGGISLKNKNKINELKKIRDFKLNFIKIDNNYFQDLPLNRKYISIATYYRLLLPEILNNNIEKIIYLDSDIIVNQDISKLWDINIENYYALVVEDEGSLHQIQRLKLPLMNNYFNAGVIVFNIKKLKSIDFQKLWKQYYIENEDLIKLQDQDILNGVLNGYCKFIDLNWNANGRIYSENIYENNYTEEQLKNAAYNPFIIHYTDENKPWMMCCTHPLKFEYLKYLYYTSYKFDFILYFMKSILFKPFVYFKHNRRKLISIKFNKREKSLKILGKKII